MFLKHVVGWFANFCLICRQSDQSPNPPPNYTIYGVCVSEVMLDVLTGNYIATRVDILEDVGNSISPSIDIGQVEGAFVMGMGLWMTEHVTFDDDGKILTNRSWNYKIPGAKDIPVDFRVYFPKNNPNPTGVLKSKGNLLKLIKRHPFEYFCQKKPTTTNKINN